MTLTPKQDAFCLTYIETGNASEAYRQAYNAGKMKPESIHRKAAELLADGKITARIEALKAEHARRHNITIDTLLNELEEARTMAKEKENPNAMTQATMGKAKLLGLDKQTVEVKTEAPDFSEWVKELKGRERWESHPTATQDESEGNSTAKDSSFEDWLNAQPN